jgi:hypothetical protein
MNNDRRAVALALVQQTIIEKHQHTITELLKCTLLADIKEIEGDQLCIRLYNNEKSNNVIIARNNINTKISTDQTASFSYLKSTMALFGAHAQGEYLQIWDHNNSLNVNIMIKGDSNYYCFMGRTLYININIHVCVIDKICKAIYAFMNRLPIN